MTRTSGENFKLKPHGCFGHTYKVSSSSKWFVCETLVKQSPGVAVDGILPKGPYSRALGARVLIEKEAPPCSGGSLGTKQDI